MTPTEHLSEHGYAIVRGFLKPDEVGELLEALERVKKAAEPHHATWRDHNLLFEIITDPVLKQKVLLQAHWAAWIEPVLERHRRDMRYFDLLSPLLGRDIKHLTQQIHWKPPGAKFTYYRYHQDVRFREQPEVYKNLETSWITTGLALNRQDGENGALQLVPGSHKMGYLGLSSDGPIMTGEMRDAELMAKGIDPSQVLQCELEPGDLLMWTLYTIHGSNPNRSKDRDRLFMLNSYVRAADTPERGEWAFRDGEPVPLGAEPEICKYEQLRERPGPFYIEDDWTKEKPAA